MTSKYSNNINKKKIIIFICLLYMVSILVFIRFYNIGKLKEDAQILGWNLYKLSEGLLDKEVITLAGIKNASSEFEGSYKSLLDQVKNKNTNLLDVEDLMNKMGIQGNNDEENDKRFFYKKGRLYMYISDLNFEKGEDSLLYKGVVVTISKSFLEDLGLIKKSIDKNLIEITSNINVNLLGDGVMIIEVQNKVSNVKNKFTLELRKYKLYRIVGV